MCELDCLGTRCQTQLVVTLNVEHVSDFDDKDHMTTVSYPSFFSIRYCSRRLRPLGRYADYAVGR